MGYTVCLIVLVRRFFCWPGNDQRCAGLINENTVHLINDGIVEGALHKLSTAKFHIITKIIEAKLVVGAIRHIGVIGLTSRRIIQVVLNDTYREAERLVQWRHPLGIALGEIIIDCDEMYALTDETVEIDGQGCHQSLPFTSFHLSDFPLVQDDAANELHIKMAHIQEAS